MSRGKNILRVGNTVILILVLVGPIRSFAATSTTTYTHPTEPDVFITEVQTASLASPGEEFIELYNATTSDIDLADTAHAGKDAWKIQYFASSKLAGLLGTPNWTAPTRTISLTGTLPANDYYVLAAGSYQPGNLVPDQAYTATLADDGGALQLVDSSTAGTLTSITVHDQLAWSGDRALPASPTLYAVPGAGVSLQRLPNTDNEYVNNDSTLTGFAADPRISPENAWTAPTPATPPDAEIPAAPDDGDEPVASSPDTKVLAAPFITELLPNPASPQTDAADEYIELYNPNDTPFDLDGFTLQTGETTLHNFTFTGQVMLDPHAYRAFYSVDTGLSLSNGGGQARLLDKAQLILSQSDTYGAASDGLAWALGSDGTWQWTLVPTPGAENVIHGPSTPGKVSVVKAAAKTTKKSTGKVKGVTTTKKKATKAKKPKASKTATTKAVASTSAPAPAPIHPSVLVAVASLAVGYMVYEYRKDMANIFYKLRTNRAARRKTRD